MKSIYNKEVLTETVARINKLNPDMKPIWGQMNPAQMFEHCARALEFSIGKSKPPRMFIGYILGPIFKSMYYNDKPWGRNTKTAPNYVVADKQDFEITKSKLLNLVYEFSNGGEEKATTHPSPFFGNLTPEQHGLGQYKHLDHHLKQFGV